MFSRFRVCLASLLAVQYSCAGESCAWRQTRGCRPDGPREASSDKGCDDTIEEGASGYCECQGKNSRIEIGCGHRVLTCAQECAQDTSSDCTRGWVPVPSSQCPTDLPEVYMYGDGVGAKGCAFSIEPSKDTGFCQCGKDRRVWLGCAVEVNFWDTRGPTKQQQGIEGRSGVTCAEVCSEKESRSECRGWRQTGSCDPNGGREQQRDRECGAVIANDASGYCECGRGRSARGVGCSHEQLECAVECARVDSGDCWGYLSLDVNPKHKAVDLAVFKRAHESDGTDVWKKIRTTLQAMLPCSNLLETGSNGVCICGRGLKVNLVGVATEAITCAEICQKEANKKGFKYGCVGWRQTAGCNADGPREPHADRQCNDMVPGGVSGYCECTGGRREKKVGCSHKEFHCDEECDARQLDASDFEQLVTRVYVAGLALALIMASRLL